MYVVSLSINAVIQEVTQCLKVGGFWSARLNEFLRYPQKVCKRSGGVPSL